MVLGKKIKNEKIKIGVKKTLKRQKVKTFSNCNGFDDFSKNGKIGSKSMFIIILLYFAFFQKSRKHFKITMPIEF